MSLASWGCCPQTPYINVISFQFHCISFQKYMKRCCWLLGAVAPRPPYINVTSFQFHNIRFQKKYGAFFLKNKYQASMLSDSLRCRCLLGAVAPRKTPIYHCNFFPISQHKLSKKIWSFLPKKINIRLPFYLIL